MAGGRPPGRREIEAYLQMHIAQARPSMSTLVSCETFSKSSISLARSGSISYWKYARSAGVYAEWIAACKGGTPAGSNFADHSGPLTEMVLLGNLAVRSGQAIDVNPETGAVLTAGIPEEYIKPKYRQGWGW